MKVIPLFPKIEPIPQFLNPINIYSTLYKYRLSTVLFVDDSELCRTYLEKNPWVWEQARIVVYACEDNIRRFKIKRVPCFQFFERFREIHEVIGTVSESDYIRINSSLRDGSDL